MFFLFIVCASLFIFALNYFKIRILIETLENPGARDEDHRNPKARDEDHRNPTPSGYKGLSLTILQPTISSTNP